MKFKAKTEEYEKKIDIHLICICTGLET
jgi:hypothetical protein